MDYADIRRLVKLVESSNISEIEIEEGGAKLRILKQSPGTIQMVAPQLLSSPMQYGAAQQIAAPVLVPAPSAPAAAPPERKSVDVLSPMVGTFFKAASSEAPAYVQIGDMVRPGQVLCIVEAMKLMNEIESEVTGRIVEILAQNAQAVEFGQLLFRIEPA